MLQGGHASHAYLTADSYLQHHIFVKLSESVMQHMSPYSIFFECLRHKFLVLS